MCVYNGDIYTSSIQDINTTSTYILSINDNSIYLKTQDNQIIQFVETNSEETFLSENYFGQRLLGCEIKDGIEKILTKTMMHDTGPILSDKNGEVLLISTENNDYTNDENYNYFYLLTSERLGSPNNISILTTKNGTALISYFGSVFKTKEPYFDYSAYENLADDELNDIQTMNGENIARKNKYYSKNSYLLADRFKFKMAISTKKDKLPIATKKHNLLIARKSSYAYKYVLQKLSDIDIIAEFLEQNNIEDTLIPYYVDKLRHHTTHMIENIQVAGAPNYYNIMATKKYSYKFDGYDYPITESNTQIYMVKNMPFTGRKDKSIFIDSMANLVLNKEIRPFIIFIGGKAIKWSNIAIVRDWYYTYMIIKNILSTDVGLDTIIFPCTIRYGEDNQVLSDKSAYMYFDNKGFLTEDIDDVAMRIEVIDPCVSGETFQLTSDINYFQLKTNPDQITFNGNIMAFETYKFFSNSRFYLQSHGKNTYTYLRDTEPIIKTFYYNKANSSKNLLLNIPNQEQVNEDAINKSKGLTSTDNAYIDNFNTPFNFKLSKNKTYSRNIAEATKYILTYNMQLLINYYKDQANFKSYNYTGEQLHSMVPEEGGYLKIPRQRKNGLDDYVIVFHNDKLYEYYKQIEYSNRYFSIPIFNHILKEDKIEILHFRNIDNTYYTINLEKGKANYIAKNLRHDNLLLFANSPSGKETYDDFNVENNIQYQLDFSYKNNWNGDKYVNTNIELKDEYYYNKRINIVSKRQFKQMYYELAENSNIFNLNPDFRFCRSQNQYLIFVDGIKLINDDFSLNYMTNDNQIRTMSIVTKNNMHKGSRINIIYIPDAYGEILIDNYESPISNKDISLDTTELGYSFDKDLFMISIDGKKILNSNIQNISSNRVRITNMNGPFRQICVNSFLQPDALLKEVFSYGDAWSTAVDSLSKEDYLKLFKKIK